MGRSSVMMIRCSPTVATPLIVSNFCSSSAKKSRMRAASSSWLRSSCSILLTFSLADRRLVWRLPFLLLGRRWFVMAGGWGPSVLGVGSLGVVNVGCIGGSVNTTRCTPQDTVAPIPPSVSRPKMMSSIAPGMTCRTALWIFGSWYHRIPMATVIFLPLPKLTNCSATLADTKLLEAPVSMTASAGAPPNEFWA
ncbi:PREDICTED: uncharacterized protein LOC108372930 [Rhagoletis zephyria]|uniref:uncharacterized protein LOC108372930 n=1 Tax=Rhagoletis zephyria TaxID=28612 RepID=UPI0008115E12|nr:PREDICTED: uncharacterized protein LOC108372930 [Rhagoletis zephyria]